jgi:hypothetical protein
MEGDLLKTWVFHWEREALTSNGSSVMAYAGFGRSLGFVHGFYRSPITDDRLPHFYNLRKESLDLRPAFQPAERG